jgi:thiamine-phosphate pyrophosphorylase
MKSWDSPRMMRIIDANFNRAGEGLRFLEEIARMVLDDASLTEELKTMRHDLIRGDCTFQARLLASRDSEGDVGVDLEVAGESKTKDLPILLVANARRVQESLRVLEETAKLPGLPPDLDSEKFKHARFALYTIEQKLMKRLLGQTTK